MLIHLYEPKGAMLTFASEVIVETKINNDMLEIQEE